MLDRFGRCRPTRRKKKKVNVAYVAGWGYIFWTEANGYTLTTGRRKLLPEIRKMTMRAAKNKVVSDMHTLPEPRFFFVSRRYFCPSVVWYRRSSSAGLPFGLFQEGRLRSMHPVWHQIWIKMWKRSDEILVPLFCSSCMSRGIASCSTGALPGVLTFDCSAAVCILTLLHWQ